MYKVDELEILDGDYTVSIYDKSDDGFSGGYELHIDDAAREEITTYPETHVLYPVMYAQFYALRKAYCSFAKADDEEEAEYWDDIACGIERSFKAVFYADR